MLIQITVSNGENVENFSLGEFQELFLSKLSEQIIMKYQNDFEVREVTEKKETLFVKKLKLISLPGVGEFLSFDKKLFYVVGIERSLEIQGKGVIFVKKTNKILQTVHILDM